MAFTLIDLAGGAGGREININIELQEKTVDSSTASQTVVPTDGYIGIKDVIVNPYVLDSSSLVVTENGEYAFTSAVDGLSRVDVSVNIDTSSYYDSGYADGEAAQKALLDTSTFTINGVYTRENGWNEVTVNVEGTVYNQDKTIDSSTVSQLVQADFGYTGLGIVTVNPYILDTSTLVATENGEFSILSTVDGLSRVDVSVNIDTSSYYDSGYSAGQAAQKALLDSSTFSANGTYTREDGWNEITVDAVNNQSKTADSSTAQQTVTFDSGYSGLSSVTITGYDIDSCYTLAASI